MLLAVRHADIPLFEQNVVEALLLEIVIGKRGTQRQIDVCRLDRRRGTIDHAHAPNAEERHAQLDLGLLGQVDIGVHDLGAYQACG